MACKPPSKQEQFAVDVNERLWKIINFYEEEYGIKNVIHEIEKQTRLLLRETR